MRRPQRSLETAYPGAPCVAGTSHGLEVASLPGPAGDSCSVEYHWAHHGLLEVQRSGEIKGPEGKRPGRRRGLDRKKESMAR